MAPKKGKEVEQANLEPVVEDPATIAARAERERLMAEDRKSFERQELIDRRRVESLEQVGLRIIYMEREKRLDPAAWSAKVGPSQPKVAQILVKPLIGNRATLQQVLTVRFTPSETNLLMLKCKIRDEATSLGLHPALFATERQKLFLLNKEVGVGGDDQHTMASTVGVHHGVTVHVALEMPASQSELLIPSKLNK